MTPKINFPNLDNTYHYYSIESLCEITDCQHSTAPTSSINTQYKMIRTSNVKGGRLISDTMDSVDEYIYHKWSIRGYLEVGDVVLTREAPMGEVAIIKDSQFKYFLGQRVLQLKANKSIILPGYLHLLLQAKTFQDLLKPLKSNGSTVSNIRIPELKKMMLPVPSIKVQTKLIEFFSLLEKLILLQEEKIKALHKLKQGLLNKILNQELNFNNGGAEIFGEWEEVKVKSICCFLTGKTKNNQLDDNGKYLVMDMGAVSENGKIISRKKVESNQDLLSIGDLIMPKDDIGGGLIIGKTAYIDEDNKYVLGDHVYLIKVDKENCNPIFAHYQFNSFQFNKKIKRLVTGSAQLGITAKNIEKESFLLPSLVEQDKIADFLYTFDNKIEKEQEKLSALQEQKGGFMQQMFI